MRIERASRRAGVSPLLALRLLTLALLTLLGPALAEALDAPTLHVVDASDTPVGGRYIQILRDPDGTLDLEAVSGSDLAERFEPAGPGTPNLGMTRATVWVRFRVVNQTSTPLVLELREARIALVDYSLLSPTGSAIAHGLGGRFRQGEGQRRDHRFDLFELPITEGEHGTVYLRIRSFANLNLNLHLTTRAAIHAGAPQDYLVLGLFFGALTIMLVYHALLYFDLRDPAHLWLCVVIGGFLVWRADFDGLLTTLIPGLWPTDWWGMLIGAFAALGGILLFDDAFLDLPRHAPRLSRVLRLSALVTFSLPLVQLVDPHFEIQAGSVLAFGIASGSVVLGVWFRKHEPGAAARFLFAWATLFVSIMLLMLVNFGLLPALPILKNLPYLGILLMLLFLSLAQAERVSQLRKTAEEASRALRRNESRLENLVQERTAELALERDRADSANQAKSRFLANMSHELRTPLNAVLGYSELLADRGYPPPDGECVAGIRSGGRVLLRLIDDILDLSRIEAGGMVLGLKPTDPRALVSDLGLMFRHGAERKGLALHTAILGEPPASVLVDPLRLRQILINLLGNAVKFTARGEVGLIAHCEPATPAPGLALPVGTVALRFEVWDTGQGIPADEQGSVFEDFTQRLGQDQASFGGTGLGLAISRRLAALMGGEIRLDSTPGVGSRFTLVLPRASVVADVPPEEPAAGAAPLRFAPSRVLVAYDHAANRDLLAATLTRLGLRLQLVADGQELLDAVAAAPPDLVLTDLAMPVMDGGTAVRRLRGDARTAGIPIVVVTASATGESEAEIRPLCDAFLTKPVERGRLVNVLRGLLETADPEPDADADADADAGPLAASAGRSDAPQRDPDLGPAPDRASGADPGRPRVLVVDDDPVMLLLVRQRLEALGLQVETSASAAAAVEAMAADPAGLALVLMDVQMTPMSGIEATQRLRQHAGWRATPIVGLTADTGPETRVRCLDAGMSEVMNKPFDAQDLTDLVTRWLPDALTGMPVRLASPPDARFAFDSVAPAGKP